MRVREGDKILLLVESEGRRRQYYVRVERGHVYSTIAGNVKSESILGRLVGEALELPLGRAYILEPTITEVMEHFYERRTQVIYPKDSGFMALIAGLRPGMRVLEAGVGSGFLTTVIALHVCPHGRVYGFDVKREYLEVARTNLEMSGFSSCVELALGDVRRGVGIEGLDAAMLDLPDPWEALEALAPSIKLGAPVVVFLPTYNQVEKVSRWARSRRSYVVQGVYETMLREVEDSPGAVRPSPRMVGFTGFIVLLRRIRDI